MSKVTRTIQYRYLDRPRSGLQSDTLSDAIRAALLAQRNGDVIGKKVRARIADLEQQGQQTVLNRIGGLTAKAAPFTGQIVLYRKGFDVPTIAEDLDDEGNSFDIVQFQSDGKNKPVEGALYFAVVGDHVGLIASSSVTARWLERYLTWLLKDMADVITGDAHIHLNASMRIQGAPSAGSAATGFSIRPEPVAAQKQLPGTITKEKARGRTVVDVLRALGIKEDSISELLNDVPADGALEGEFRVYIKEGNRKKEISSDTIDHAYRNLDPDDVDIDMKGSKVRGRLFSLSESARINEIGAVLDPDDAIAKIVEQLYKWNTLARINLGPME